MAKTVAMKIYNGLELEQSFNSFQLAFAAQLDFGCNWRVLWEHQRAYNELERHCTLVLWTDSCRHDDQCEAWHMMLLWWLRNAYVWNGYPVPPHRSASTTVCSTWYKTPQWLVVSGSLGPYHAPGKCFFLQNLWPVMKGLQFCRRLRMLSPDLPAASSNSVRYKVRKSESNLLAMDAAGSC